MRLPYVQNPPPATTPEESAIITRIQARRAPRPLQPLDLTLLHSPQLADGWNSFLGAVRTKGILAPLIRELAICRVAVYNEAWYEWVSHEPLLTQAGMSASGLEIVKRTDLDAVGDAERRDAGLGQAEWAVLRYTDEMTRSVRVADETFAELRRFFDEKEVVEITTTVACYNCVSRFLVALDVGERNGTGPGEARP
ncbi:AhpD-like protein [Xylaria nigripes]|nr:AhpD-like protein [Xylaria nigripes]